jgi:lysozyme
MNPVVADVFHLDRIIGDRPGEPNGLIQALNAGIQGLIHKATQGVRTVDPLYASRRAMAAAAGIPLWGAYDFNTADPVEQQVDFFFDAARPDASTFCVIDFEDNSAGNMTLAQLLEYLRLADARLGRMFGIYSGNRIKQVIPAATEEERAFLAEHPLWLCEYGPTARLVDVNGRPLPWSSYMLWQCSADGAGPLPHSVPGIAVNGLDLSVIAGTIEKLAADWIGGAVSPAASPIGEVASEIEAAFAPRAPAAAVPTPSISPAPGRQTHITATCFGGAGDNEASAYGGRVDPAKPGVALPFRFRVPSKVIVYRGDASVVCDIVDVGPHNTNDPYWLNGARPLAESQNGNHAGIDMTPATFAALGIVPNDPAYGETLVDWAFAQ